MQPAAVRKMLVGMVEGITLGEVKVAILGTYQNVATGDVIVDYIMKNLSATSVSYAERIGQDLVGHGFLRLVGTVGNTFANSSKMHYQFRPKAFQWAGVNPKPVNKLTRAPTIQMNGESEISSPAMAYVGDYLGSLLTNQYPNETTADRLRREAREADEKYKAGVKQLDLMRCHLEESMMDHLKFMDRCELDRLKAIKAGLPPSSCVKCFLYSYLLLMMAVILDFSGAISNVIPAIQSTVDNLMLYQETVQPLGDLRYLLESYRTGSYVPKVITYESYYNSPDGWFIQLRVFEAY
jgi:rRNA processing protein Krr1/Pno1